ncbi:MAG: hybrid sensor histidine kinase/response regulator [Geminocystis sp.]|nr:hybrid sensor histidine kinase/response regulator [Geminocystis sp.]MDW8464332.1 hybrid sensor histidine kinase/response regulator [Geminocystis sp.]
MCAEYNVWEEKRETILVVDDVAENLTVLLEMLSKNNYDIRACRSGELALKSLNNFKPDLILLDIKTPNMDGYQVAEKIKSNPELADIPIIFVSALDDISEKIRAFKVGGVDYVTKPFQEEEVLARIATHLRIKKQEEMLKQEIEKRQLAELQLEKNNEELRGLNQDLQIFNRSLSHDLRNYLSVIIGAAVCLLNFYPLDEEVKNWVSTIHDKALQMNRLLESLLFLYVPMNELGKQPVNLSDLVLEIIQDLRGRKTGKKAVIKVEKGLGAMANGPLLRVALENILINAWKYSSFREEIHLEFGKTYNWRPEAFYRLYPLQKSPPPEAFFVKDNGSGFELEKVQEIFLPLTRLRGDKERVEGYGLGLSIVKRIIESHGGFIWCDSVAGEGSIFYFTL